MFRRARAMIVSILAAASFSIGDADSGSAASTLPDPAKAGFAEKALSARLWSLARQR